ncbi:hypothetical protein ABT097_28135 [Streptomyces sp. NPDC002225]|uniref:hypothetical protein n=1 Tax=Streptomyces sp. NPDC002225 TaxID=3154413 RepID=UPI003328C4F2
MPNTPDGQPPIPSVSLDEDDLSLLCRDPGPAEQPADGASAIRRTAAVPEIIDRIRTTHAARNSLKSARRDEAVHLPG